MSPNMLAKHVKQFVKRTPLFYVPAKKLFGESGSGTLCTPDTDLCIEGFPSSANSFAHALIRSLNPDLTIAHHCHSVANIKLSLRYGVPAIGLIRDPVSAISSNIARFHEGHLYDNARIEDRVFEYVSFNHFLLAHNDAVCLVLFEDMIQRTEQIIDKIQSRYGIALEYDDLTVVKAGVERELHEFSARRNRLHRVSLPSSEREQVKTQLRERVTKSASYELAVKLYTDLQAKTRC